MRLLEHRANRRLLFRRWVSAVLIGAYAVTAAGIPLPFGGQLHKGGELYPCADHACGCASAEQCWRSCCCHTLAERFEWAEAHHVRPPEFAIAEARRAGLDLAWLGEKPDGHLCSRSDSHCKQQAVAAPPTCCRAKALACDSAHSCCHCCSDQHNRHPSATAASRVIGWRALECQGHSSTWLAAVPTLIVPTCNRTHDLSVVDWLGPARSEHADRAGNLPAIPPPERRLAFAILRTFPGNREGILSALILQLEFAHAPRMFVLGACVALAVSTASAHGPQIQVTDTNNKITTRELILNEPYDSSLTSEKSVYVLPIRKAVSGDPSTDYWTVMPNDSIDPIQNTNTYQFGPGLEFSYGHTFTTGSHLNGNVTDFLKKWDGSAFTNDPGPEAVGVFRGDSLSSADAAVFSGTSDPSTTFAFSAINGTDNQHSSMRYRILGDGSNALIEPSDGIYLVKLHITSTQADAPAAADISLMFYKNVAYSDLTAAVGSLGVDSSLVQIIAVPEPAVGVLALSGLAGLLMRRRARRRNED